MPANENAESGPLRWWSRLLKQRHSSAKAPEGMRIYAVGDIHGRKDLLDSLLAQITADAARWSREYSIVFLGDYVDRGPNSKGVIETLMRLNLPGWEIVCLRGNHDQAVLDFLDDAQSYRAWKDFGGIDTLLSYGVRPPRYDNVGALIEARDEFVRLCPPSHLDFLRTLKYYHIAGDYMFAHAGVRPGISLTMQSA